MTPLLQIAGWTLIHFVWEGLVIAAVAATALRLADRRSANVRYVIACVGLATMLAAPVVTARLLWADAQFPAAVSSSATDDAALKGGATPSVARAFRYADDRTAVAQALGPAGVLRDLGFVPFDRVVPSITIVWLIGVALLLGRMAGGGGTFDVFTGSRSRAHRRDGRPRADGLRTGLVCRRPLTSSNRRSSTCRPWSAGCVRRFSCRWQRSPH